MHRKLEDLMNTKLERRTGIPGFLETCDDARSIRQACIRIVQEFDGLGKGDGRITFRHGIDRCAITIKR